jgi:hypothetical protein
LKGKDKNVDDNEEDGDVGGEYGLCVYSGDVSLFSFESDFWFENLVLVTPQC